MLLDSLLSPFNSPVIITEVILTGNLAWLSSLQSLLCLHSQVPHTCLSHPVPGAAQGTTGGIFRSITGPRARCQHYTPEGALAG